MLRKREKRRVARARKHYRDDGRDSVDLPHYARSTPNVDDMSSRKRAVRIPRVLAAKLEIIKEGRNNLLSEAFLST